MTPEKRNSESTLTGYSPPLLRPKNSLRWSLFVTMNLLGYAAACLFWRYVQSGSWVDFRAGTFRRDLAASLGQVLLEPLGVFTHPWMIFVIGALLAVLISVPLATAVMYPLLLAMVFVVMTAVLAHAPWLALALAAGCLLAARSRLRREYPYLAALLGFVPVGIYLYLLTYAGIDATLLLPLQRWILAVPFALATLLTALALALVVWTARLLKFQPGVIWPIWLLLLPLSAAVFHRQVGPAELHYALLTRSLAPGDSLLSPMPREEWTRRFGPGLNEINLQARLDDDLVHRRKTLDHACEEFLRAFPRGDRAPSAAWIAAQAQSLQRDRRAGGEKLISYTAAWPTSDSAAAWRRLLESYSDSPQAALAQWRLGELAFREAAEANDEQALGKAAQADRMLRNARDRLRDIVAQRRREEPLRRAGVFTRYPSLPRLGVYERALFEAELLTWRIAQNDVLKDPRCARALASLTALNPYEPEYARNVKRLARKAEYRDTPMADNLRMAVAKLRADPYDRAEAMLPLAADQRTDAAIEAHFELGRTTMQTAQARAISLIEGIGPPEAYFRIVVAAPPNPWQDQAKENLRWLQSANPPQGEH
ncbi:MAG: hypothetical protein JW849_10390 [Phycisphaerae bacterium]|nr:hypothetical protein [Phycisphaerae bacterium]